MQVPTFVFRLKQFKSLCLTESAARPGMMLQNEIYKWLADNHAYLDRFTGIIASLAAGTLKDRNIRRSVEH